MKCIKEMVQNRKVVNIYLVAICVWWIVRNLL